MMFGWKGPVSDLKADIKAGATLVYVRMQRFS